MATSEVALMSFRQNASAASALDSLSSVVCGSRPTQSSELACFARASRASKKDISAPPTAGPLSGVAGAEFMNRGPHPLRERRNAKRLRQRTVRR